MSIVKRSFFWASCIVITGISGCTTTATADPVALSCGKDSVDRNCILQAAASALDGIENDRDWIAAAAEYAIALDVVSQKGAARQVLKTALEKANGLEDQAKQLPALLELSNAFAEIGANDLALKAIDIGEGKLSNIENLDKRIDLGGKFASARAAAGQIDTALTKTRTISNASENAASFKARTFREIATYQAEVGDFEGAVRTISEIDGGLTYYWSTARSDVAELAFAAKEDIIANKLLIEADKIARAQEDGYFVAGALRDIGKAYLRGSDPEKAESYFNDARAAALTAKSPQHRARSLSRVATGMSDCQLYKAAASVIPTAIALASKEKSKIFQNFALYEVVGSAAFAGDFETAFNLLDGIPDIKFSDATSLKGATQRDIAWGLARHGQTQRAVKTARNIAKPRERVQALSRIVRLMVNPKMDAFPRYL